jgi:hypothetical protein
METLTANYLYDVYQQLPVVEQEKFYHHIRLRIAQNKENPVVGYEINGTPITRALLKQQLQESIFQVEAGEFTTDEELEKKYQHGEMQICSIFV